MRIFLVLMTCLGAFTLLVNTFSLWAAFAIAYLASMVLLFVIALF